MTTPDPFALARSRTTFTLEEAARLICDVPLSRIYPAKSAAWTQEQRDEFGMVQEALSELKRAAPGLGVTVTHHAKQTEFRINSFTGQTYPAATHPAREEFGEVTRPALVDWCEARGLRPAALFGKPINANPTSAANAVQTGELTTRERETLLGLIGVLCEAAGIDLSNETKGHAEAARIITWATDRNVRTSKETIAAKITAARELIAPKGPVQHDAGAGGRSNSNRRKSSSNKSK